jgi:hypothetical protein
MGRAKGRARRRCYASRLADPFFRGSIFNTHGQLNYSRFRSDLEYIFTNEFPEWDRKTASRLPAKVGNRRQRIHEWYKKWTID